MRSALLITVVFAVSAAPGFAQEDPFKAMRSQPDIAPPEQAVDRLGWNPSLDLEFLGRSVVSFDGAGEHAIGAGVEGFSRIVTRTGTWGEANVQLRLFWLEPAGAGRFETHNAYLEKRFLFGRLNLRAGHFQVPFNLEALPIDTHTTLIQLSNMRAVGLKHDWGLMAGGQLKHLDYQVAYTLGAGMEPGLPGAGMGTGRLGWRHPVSGLELGISAFGGERRVMERAETGWRGGLDAGWSLGPVVLRTEASAGGEEGRAALSALGRLEAETPGRLLWAALQAMTLRVGTGDAAMTAHRYEAEGALRLAFISRDTFLRTNLAVETGHDETRWVSMTMLYLRFGLV